MEKNSLRNLRDGYGTSKQYNQIANIIWKEVEHKVRDEMGQIPETVELERLIQENNKTYFDRESEMAFQVDYGFTDDYGEDYPDYQFSEDLYNGYHNFINNFDNILADIESRKQKLMSTKIVFGRAKKLEALEDEKKDKTRTYNYYMSIYEREKKFKETWYKDGIFIDLNKDHKEKLAEIRKGVVEKLVTECFDKHPELMMYDFYCTGFTKDVLKAIDNEQKSRTLTTKKNKKAEASREELEGYEMQ